MFLPRRRKQARYATSQAQAIISAFTTAPTPARQSLIITTANALAGSSFWAKLDILYVMAAETAQAARINWRQPGTYDATVTGSPTFTADRGYTSGGNTGNTLDTGFNPTTSTRVYAQDSAHYAVWSRTSGNIAASTGNTNTTLVPYNGTAAQLRLNSAGAFTATNTDGAGYFCGIRPDSTQAQLFKNGASISGLTANASAAPTNANFYAITRNAVSAGDIQFSVFHCGSVLTSAEIAALHSILRNYMTSVGAA